MSQEEDPGAEKTEKKIRSADVKDRPHRFLSAAEVKELLSAAQMVDPRIQFIQETVRRMLPEIVEAVLQKIDPDGPWKRHRPNRLRGDTGKDR